MRRHTLPILSSFVLISFFTTNAYAQTCAKLFDPIPQPSEIAARTGYLVWSKIGDTWVVRLDDVLLRQGSRIAQAQATAAGGRKMHDLRPSLNDLIHDWNFKKENGESVPVDRRLELPHIESGMYAGYRVFGIHTEYGFDNRAIEAGTLERYLRLDRPPANVVEALRTGITVTMTPYEGVVRLVEVRDIARRATLVVTIETDAGKRIELHSLDAISNGAIRTMYSLAPALPSTAQSAPRSKSSPR